MGLYHRIENRFYDQVSIIESRTGFYLENLCDYLQTPLKQRILKDLE